MCTASPSPSGSTTACTIIAYRYPFCIRKHNRLHNYCVQTYLLPPEAQLPAQLLRTDILSAIRSTTACTIIAYRYPFCHRKHNRLHTDISFLAYKLTFAKDGDVWVNDACPSFHPSPLLYEHQGYILSPPTPLFGIPRVKTLLLRLYFCSLEQGCLFSFSCSWICIG